MTELAAQIRYLCDCGHPLCDHHFDGEYEPCENGCGCPNYHWRQTLKRCGHLQSDECPSCGPPHVRVKRVEMDGEAWVIDCPYCRTEHRHTSEPGHRVAHCHQGDGYVLVAPPDELKRRKLPFRKVWDRDDWTCVTCGTHKHLTVDHIIPVSKGGTDDLANLQTMCGRCNSSKGNRI